jgi:hypothetical protein
MRRSLLCIVVVSLALGCAGDKPGASFRSPKDKDKDKAGARQDPAGAPAVRKPGDGVKEEPKTEARKIIYTGQVELIVEDFDQGEQGLLKLLGELKGYVASSETTGRPGEPRSGHWVLRIPTERFDDFISGAKALGEMRRQQRDTQDVTDRYFDTKAQMLNLEAREKALRKLYEEKIAGSKLTDLLDVDRELNKVRGEINLLKGQLQRWDKLVEFATLTVTMHDRKGYVPPEGPPFATIIGRTFSGSIDALVLTGQGLVLVLVALAPWLVVLAVLGIVVWLPLRKTLRRGSAPLLVAAPAERLQAQEPPPPPPTA